MKSAVRKIVRVGGKSYAMTLPKKWVKAFGLSHGDGLYVVANDDGTLTVVPLKSARIKQTGPIAHVALPQAVADARSIFKVVLALYSAGLSEVVLGADVPHDAAQLLQDIAKVEKSSHGVALLFREPRADISEVLETMAYKTREVFKLFFENIDRQSSEVWKEIHIVENEVDILSHLALRLIIRKLIKESLDRGPESESIAKGILDALAGRILEGLTDCVDRSVHRIKELSAISKDYGGLFTKIWKLSDEAIVCYLHKCPIDEVIQHLNTASNLRIELKELMSTSIPPLLPLLSELEVAITLLEDLLEVTLTMSYR
ncbi:MAG: AbrB/MazE/SpoVT family DNA-binding domain-containing protein [Sulfolobales archaeon]|nr:AbrB/MazE/SpoVT family DNA-binding domain-containing protein [Sulfolobales archaeon]